MNKFLLIIFIAAIFFSCTDAEIPKNSKENKSKINTTQIINYTYVKSFPHDINSFTEGFLVYKGDLYESTGATSELPQTKSLFGIVDSLTGKINTKVELDRAKYFGEGITFLNGKVYQLTYKSKIGFVYDAFTFEELSKFRLPSEEGWGLTTDGTYLIMSDGTSNLIFLDATTLAINKILPVSENGILKDNLNELEYINGYIYANVWTTNNIVKIDPENGKVMGVLDLTALKNEALYGHPNSMELNGIAFNSVTDKIYVTGKLWPKYFEIKFPH